MTATTPKPNVETFQFKTIGHRTIMNTAHGIYADLRRWSKPREWTVSITCNGTVESSTTFRTKREAVAAYNALGAEAAS